MRSAGLFVGIVVVLAALAPGGRAGAQAEDAGVAEPAPQSTEAAGAPEDEGAAVTAAPADAQDADEDAEQASGPTPEQAALLESVHITELAQTTRAKLRDARPLLREASDVLRIGRELPAQEAQLARLTTPARLAQIGLMSQRELVDLRQEWRGYRERYEDWQQALASRGEALETARSELVELRRTWRALRDAAQADASSGNDARLERIETSLEQVRDAAGALEERHETVQALEDRVTELLIDTDEVSDTIRDALADYRQRLLVRDRAPIWRGLGDDVLAAEEVPWPENVRAQWALFADLAPSFARLFALTLALAVALEALKRRTRWGDDDAPLHRAFAERPVAMALVLGLLAAGVVVSHAPMLLDDAVAVLLLGPTLWLVWRHAGPTLRALLALVTVFTLVDHVEATMNDGSVARRVILLGESLLAAGGLVAWVVRARSEAGSLHAATRVLAGGAALVLAVGIVANVLGYVFLATILVRGTALSLSGALTLATAYVVLDALVLVLSRSPLLHRLHGVRLHRALILARVQRGVGVVVALGWALLVLGAYGLATPFFSWLDDVLEARGTFGTLELSLGEILAAALVLAASWAVTRFVLFVLELDVLPRLPLEPGVDGAIAGLTRYVLFGTGLILSLATLGIDASQIALVAGALGVGVGFGLQGIVANFIAGIVLMLERPVRLGDRIEVGALAGRVERIGLRSSTVRGDDGADVIVPNESLISREVVNWTLSDRKRRVQLQVGVAYGTDPRRVLEIIRAAVLEHPEVLTQAKGASDPAVQFTGFGASSLDFVVKFWAGADESENRIRGEIGVAVLDALVAAGIEIPFPQQDVYVKSLPSTAAPAPQTPPSDATPPKP